MHSLIEVWAPGVSGSHPESLTCTRVPCPPPGPSAPWALTSPLQPASLSLEGTEKNKVGAVAGTGQARWLYSRCSCKILESQDPVTRATAQPFAPELVEEAALPVTAFPGGVWEVLEGSPSLRIVGSRAPGWEQALEASRSALRPGGLVASRALLACPP